MTKRLRILLVEDNPVDVDLIHEVLSKARSSEFEIIAVECLSDALFHLKSDVYDLVLLDLGLPDSTGIETLQILREAAPDLAVVVLTGNDDEATGLAVVETGAQDYLVKGQIKNMMLMRSIRYAIQRKRAEEEREKMQAQLAQAQKLESVGRLAGGMAHDFNNILTVILGCIELAMLDTPPQGTISKNLTMAQNAAWRAAEIIRQLLAFASKQIVAPKKLDLNCNIEEMLKMLRRLIGEGIEVIWMPERNLWPIEIDPSQVDQILINLVVNARNAITGVGKITLKTENVTIDEVYCANHVGSVPGAYVMLATSDDGCGMDKGILDRLFEPFFTTKGMGHGLGLAIVYGIVKQNGGFIDVFSQPGEGTTFQIYLPQFTGQAGGTLAELVVETPSGHGETVLLVEDDTSILKLGGIMLNSLGYVTLTAGTPGDALRQAETRAEEIHLLITDVVMPEMDGRTLAARVAAIKPGLKCLYMSGYTTDDIAHYGLLEETVHFLPKPFSLQVLASKVREALK